MEFKGSRGKWCTEFRNGNHYIHKEKSNIHREYIGQMFYLKNNENTHNLESYYNALLISKAPEILDMLKDSVEVIKWYMENSTTELHEPFFNIGANQIEQTEQLIRKATEL